MPYYCGACENRVTVRITPSVDKVARGDERVKFPRSGRLDYTDAGVVADMAVPTSMFCVPKAKRGY